MSWVAVAVVGGAAIGAIGSASAADTQAGGQKQAAQTQLDMFNKINQQQQPYIQGGYSALSDLMYGLNGSGGAPRPSMGSTPQPGVSGFPVSAPSGPGWQPSGGGGMGLHQMMANGPTGAPTGGGMTSPTAPQGGGGFQLGQGYSVDQGGDPTQPGGGNSVPPTQPGQQPVMSGGGMPGPSGAVPAGYFTQQFDPNSVENNPAFQFALKTGGQATRNADTPGMGALSGAALKDLTAFNVGTANSYENQYFNQFQNQQNNIFDRLSSIAGLGQNAAAQVGNNGATLGTGVAQAQAGAAASQAGGIVGATNAITNGASTLGGMMYMGGNSPGYTPPMSNYTPQPDTTYPSDIRFKTNLKRIATSARGNPVYTWDWKTGGKGSGVIAQEVAHIPGAVSADADGMLRVNYAKV